ncbi:MAG: hypothetical protein GF328_13960 [Candidatus Latescibacteria bacterium]|nr:hypothetical protein [Candidatus Latescibacterota bacterium]
MKAAGPPMGSAEDLAIAGELWREMEDYTSWDPWPDRSGWQEGKSPHGKFVKFYVDETAAQDLSALADGAIIIKENYAKKSEDALKSLTVMQKREGYAPDHGDWFWVKYGPDGEVMANENGVKLAGRVAKGTGKGCIACHENAEGDDYVFTND